MNEEPGLEINDEIDTEQLIIDIKALKSRIDVLRITIAFYLLSSRVRPQRGRTPNNEI